MPFKDSRRLAGANPFVPAAGVALDVIGIDLDGELFAAWRLRVERVRSVLGWPASATVVPDDAGITTLAFEAPVEHLAVALEVNEWAICSALAERDPGHWSCLRDSLGQGARIVGKSGQPVPPPEIDEAAAIERFRRLVNAFGDA